MSKYERWTPHPTPNYSRGYIIEASDGYNPDLTYQWGVELDGRLIDSVSIVNINDHDQKAVLGYCLAKEFWSKGYTTEAVKAVLKFIFTEVEINRIEPSHAVKNIPSGRVLHKAGMHLEGCAKDYYFSNSGVQDSDLYAITKEQYLRLQSVFTKESKTLPTTKK